MLSDRRSIDSMLKELLKISRKHAVDLLEYFDKKHLTIRKDNHRLPGKILDSKN